MLGAHENLRESLAEIGESGRGFGRNVAVGDGGKQARECGGEVVGGKIARGETLGDPFGGEITSERPGFLASMSRAKEGVVVAKRATTAAIGKGVGTHVGAILRALRRHRKSPEMNFEL